MPIKFLRNVSKIKIILDIISGRFFKDLKILHNE